MKLSSLTKATIAFPNRYLWIAVFFFCSFFIANSLTLSNYGEILGFLGVEKSAPLIGHPKLLPGLDLEVHIYTPQFQILVNNDFQRINHTSPFAEDLKSLYSLPILDWALVFKPNMWAFFIVPPEYAFSLFHLIALLLFITGYYRLGVTLGAKPSFAFIFSTALFFSGYVQAWWILFGTSLAIFPWVILILLNNLNTLVKSLLLYYVLCCWLISNLYPPMLVGLAFVGALIYIALTPDFYKKKQILALGVASAFAVITVLVYLWEPINAIKNSVYPGNRVATGGADFPAVLWLSQIFPALLQAGPKSLIAIEMAEAAAVTSYLAIILLFFKDFRNWFNDENRQVRLVFTILFTGLLLMWAWMLLPLPSWSGSVFLWDHVQPRRMVAASGLMIFAICCFISNKFPWKISAGRLTAFSCFILLPWIAFKQQSSANTTYKLIDLLPVIVCGIYFVYIKIRKTHYEFLPVLVAALLVNIAIFGRYNTLQSAQFFFSRPTTEAIQAIQAASDSSQEKIVALNRFEGAVLNGLGFKSAGHALITPQPQVYRRFFSSLPEETFNFVFNRTASIRLFYDVTPNSGGLGVNVPIDSFGAKLDFRPTIITSNVNEISSIKGSGGDISDVQIKDGRITMVGSAQWSGLNKEQKIYILTETPLNNVSLKYAVNGRGGEYILSSFHLSFDLSDDWGNKTSALPICLYSSDPKLGVYKLEIASSLVSCNQSGTSP